MTITIRRIRADEWRRVKELRLAALRDPLAHLAFLETYEEASAWPDSRWEERARSAASGGAAAQFVAEGPDGWVGSVAVLIFRTGDTDYYGLTRTRDDAVLVGVYIDPALRREGILESLIAAAAEWTAAQGLAALHLDVHPDNERAARAYERCGFRDTGARIDSDGVWDIRMALDLPRV